MSPDVGHSKSEQSDEIGIALCYDVRLMDGMSRKADIQASDVSMYKAGRSEVRPPETQIVASRAVSIILLAR